MKTILKTCLLASALILSGLHLKAEAVKAEAVFTDKVVTNYLDIQKALANDQFAEAQSAAKTLLDQLNRETPEKIKSTVAGLIQSTESIATAEHMRSARREFKALSNGIQLLIEEQGTTGMQDLYVVRCRMAFKDKGANWIQADTAVTNPYFGAQMPRCGNVLKQIAEKTRTK
jgi:hypothetical protein